MQSKKTDFAITTLGNDADTFDSDKKKFQGIFGSFPLDYDLSGAAETVYNQMWQQLKVCDTSYRFLVAYAGSKIVGMMIMAKSKNERAEWSIFDLLSMEPGAGTALATAGVRLALTDEPEKPITLLSLDQTSTAFWQKRGFKLVKESDKESTGTVPMIFLPR